MEDIIKAVKNFILTEFLPGENPDELTPSTPLITGGIIDSLATLKLTAFLEEQYNIEIEAHEMDPDSMDTISQIADLIQSKLERKS